MATTEESGIEMSPVSVGPNTRCGVHVEVLLPDMSPNMAYSPHENVSPRNALANAIAINPNEAYGVPAEVNISSTNHPTDAAIVVNPNEAYGVPTEVNISSTNHPTDAAIVVNPNEAYGAIDIYTRGSYCRKP